MQMNTSLKLSVHTIKSLQCGRVFKNNVPSTKQTKEVNSIDFSEDGEFLVSASDDDTVRIYNCVRGEITKEIFCRKYGVDLIKFSHHTSAVLCASKNESDFSIRYLSLHDTKYLRYFKGHKARVVGLTLSPFSDDFASASLDDTVRFWDLNSNACKALLKVKGRSSVAFDPKNENVVAVACPINYVKLYDIRSLDKGPFNEYFIDANPLDYVDISFSPYSANYLLISTSKNIVLLDAKKGTKLREISDYSNETDTEIKATFTPDEQFIISGSDDGSIHFWETTTGQKVHVLKGHAGPVANVAWSPRYATMASACCNVCLWIPAPMMAPAPQFMQAPVGVPQMMPPGGYPPPGQFAPPPQGYQMPSYPPGFNPRMQ